MNNLLFELENVHKTEVALDMQIKYIAYCYVNNITDMATMISKNNNFYDCSYNYVLHRLIQYIRIKYNNSVHVDINTLMTYLDYYYDLS